ncbi:MAG: hypothetical protein H0X17_11425 [Deltaproteobacteria bacterium]|nr:hypothetical protein [Deltaproteobacteria bacterium]
MSELAVSEIWLGTARLRLVRVIGSTRAAEVVAEILAELELSTLGSADDLARFGARLSHREGFLGAVGVSLETHAILRGSRLRR